MNKQRKIKLLNYLYPNEEVARFSINNLYLPLENFLPRKTCFSNDNHNSQKRKSNLETAIATVSSFLNNNPATLRVLYEYYPYISFEDLLLTVLYGYLLYLTPNINKGTGADIFADKRSICYSPVSIIDII